LIGIVWRSPHNEHICTSIASLKFFKLVYCDLFFLGGKLLSSTSIMTLQHVCITLSYEWCSHLPPTV
jgi:hypothetical protein